MRNRAALFVTLFPLGLSVTVMAMTALVQAHCDTMDGPVVAAGRAALQEGDLTPVLKWVKAEHEAELHAAFDRARRVQDAGAAAKDLAEQYFLETLVRLHRAGEGEPYTGLKPAGQGVTPAVAAADQALQSGQIDAVVKRLTDEVGAGVRSRYQRVREAAKRMNQSVQAGREYVAAYVDYVHYVEQIERLATTTVAKAHESGSPHTGTVHRHGGN